MFFSALHRMPARTSNEKGICPSVCPSVCPSRGLWQNGKKSVQIFTALHGMQTRSCDENYVCPSVCLSVKRVDCDKTEEQHIFSLTQIGSELNVGSRYDGVCSANDWWTGHASLNSTLRRTGSQCNLCRTGEMRSHRRVPVVRRAAAFYTDWTFCRR